MVTRMLETSPVRDGYDGLATRLLREVQEGLLKGCMGRIMWWCRGRIRLGWRFVVNVVLGEWCEETLQGQAATQRVC